MGYFRGIRPGLIEASLRHTHTRLVTGISGASAPASLKRAMEQAGSHHHLSISGASAPASLKLGLVDHQQPPRVGISGASAPASLKHVKAGRDSPRFDVFPGHPPRPH